LVDQSGLFRIPLSDACKAIFPMRSLIWYVLTIDGSESKRTPVGAVPYALSAGRAGGLVRQLTITEPAGTVRTTFLSSTGLYCGATAPTTAKFVDATFGTVGVVAAKTLCESACSSQTAHICLSEDILRARLMLGVHQVVPVLGWVAGSFGDCRPQRLSCASDGSPVGGWFVEGEPYTSDAPLVQNGNCNGLVASTTNMRSIAGPGFDQVFAPPGPDQAPLLACNSSHPILCCD
jgi:hypothetical protein